MATIEIDFEVWKKITSMRKSESDSENDVLRRLLKLGESKAAKPVPAPNEKPWVIKGVSIPHGTKFKFTHKGNVYTATVIDGRLETSNGNRYTSPSAAASEFTGTNVNGWITWECLLPETSIWVRMDTLRLTHKQ